MTDEVPPSKLYLDTNIFCAAFEGPGPYSEILGAMFEALEGQPKRAVTSELTLAELLGSEAPSLGWAKQTRLYHDLLLWRRFIDLQPVSRAVLLETADYRRAARRSGRRIKLPDSIHVVTAIKSGCDFVISADKRFLVPSPLRIDLDSDGIATIKSMFDA